MHRYLKFRVVGNDQLQRGNSILESHLGDRRMKP
jgi:hypothetical protein